MNKYIEIDGIGEIVPRSEYDALAAQVEALRDAASEASEALGFLSHHLQGRMGEAALMDMAEKADALNDALNNTQTAFGKAR